MRIFVSAGLNDILKGASRDTIVERFMKLKEVIERQNLHHPHAKNEPQSLTLPNLFGLTAMDPHPLILKTT